MSTENKPEEAVLFTPVPFADPDIEALLMAIYGLFIPIAHCAYQVYNHQQPYKKGDARVIQTHLQKIKPALARAQSILDELDKIVLLSKLPSTPIWPVGNHGVKLAGDGNKRYLEMVKILVEVFKGIDSACTALLSYALPKKKSTSLEGEIKRLQIILEKVLISKTYGEKLKYLRWSISISQNVLDELLKFF
jgi:hypothetical protein